MSEISRNESKIIIAPNGTWGTAAAGLHQMYGLVSNTVTDGRFDNRGVGYNNFRTDVTRLEHSVDAQVVSDIIHNGAWSYLVAAFFGDETKTEGTDGDFLHVLELMPNNDGKFVTLSYLNESDRAVEIPSFKPNTLTFEHNVNEVGTITLGGFAERVLTTGWTNGPSQINSADPVSEALHNAVLGGANHSFKINLQSDGALDDYDELPIMGYTLTLTRQHEQRFRLRGANSRYTVEPKQRGGFVDMQLTVRFSGLDSSIWDVLALWRNSAMHKCSITCTGQQIAGNVLNLPAAYNIEIPAMKVIDFPEGTDIPDNTGAFDPVVTFDIFAPLVEPAGMTGYTQPVVMTIVNDNSADLLL